MPDTIRTLSELNALLADNNTANISPQDIRDILVSINVYGEIGASGNSPINLASGWQPLDLTVPGNSTRGVVVNTTSKWIEQVPVDMEVDLTFHLIFKGQAGRDYDFTVFKNPDSTPVQMNRMNILNIEANETRSLSWSTSINVTQGDKLQAAVRPSADSSNFELLHGVFRLQRKGIE
jgi:hypothetical protein